MDDNHPPLSTVELVTRRKTLTTLLLVLLGAASFTAGCAGGADATALAARTCALRAPDLMVGQTGRFWFVAADCGAGDGSLERPFNALQLALKAAKPGDAIAVSEMRISGGTAWPAGVHLLALEKGKVMLSGGIGLRIEGEGRTTISGVVIDSAEGLGLEAVAGRLRLEDVVIRNTKAAAGLPGHGVDVSNLSQLTLIRTAITDNAGVGIVARKTTKVAIIEPIYLPSPRNTAGKYGIIEPIYLPTSRIADNGLGGVAIIEPIYSPAGAPNLRLESTRVTGNSGFGVGLWGASARIINSAIDATKVGAGGAWADGVMLAAGLNNGQPVAVQIDARTVVTGNARTGVAMLAKATLQVSADVSNNKLCGIWAGQASLINVTGDAVFGNNTLLGVAVTEGADLLLDGATIRGTVAQVLAEKGADREAGDGIGIFGGARATIRNARLQNNARAGVVISGARQLADGSPDVLITGSVVSGGKYAVVVNGSPAPSFKAENTYEASRADDNGDSNAGQGTSGGTASPPESPKDKNNATMPVKTQICEQADSCAPKF